MTSHSGRHRYTASAALALGLWTGFGVPAAFAEPAQPTETETPTAAADTRAPGESCTGEDCAKPVEGEAAPAKMSADEALSMIHDEYAQGDGGGHVSKLIDDVMTLRAQGFRPSNANAAALAQALEYRPNQAPLVEALKATLAYQRKLQAQAAAQPQPPTSIGINQTPEGQPPPITIPLG
ncbi:hypothetical protein [Mycobacterium hubeiense]|uniref:hypothetical protein n=1 Tax=Mycobacterium hubeiense TaxID=1867256 RepID=UPI000C7F2F02|nr:hypothetical protein [Mycobacterium sp. QGD 101]